MERGGLDLKLSTDRSHIQITTKIDGDIKSQIELAEAQVDSIIFFMMSLRKNMQSEVPFSKPQQRGDVTEDPVSEISRSAETDRFCLSLRHPGLGWLDWSFSREALMDVLQKAIAALKAQ